jgi:hypothetical protein
MMMPLWASGKYIYETISKEISRLSKAAALNRKRLLSEATITGTCMHTPGISSSFFS